MQSKDDSAPNISRMQRAKDQLAGAIRKLKKGTLFNIVAFSNSVRSWQKKLVIATPKTIRQAAQFVESLRANGATHTDDAMEEAFKDLRVDTIILLSDGSPMKQTERDPSKLVEKILRWVADTNSSRKVRIDTFGFEGKVTAGPGRPGGGGAGGGPGGGGGGGSLADFLQRLAKDNGGTYRPIK